MGYERYWPVYSLAVASCGIVLFAAAQEIIRLVLNGLRLSDRYRAYALIRLPEYDRPYADCLLYYVPSTDTPSHPAGVGTASIWRSLDVLFLVVILLEEMPTPYYMSIFQRLLRAFGPDAGPWFVGYLIMTIAAGILAAPVGVVGNTVTARLREIGGWALFADGFVVFMLGILYKQKTRVLRGQVEAQGSAPNKKYNVRTKFGELRVVLSRMQVNHLEIGALQEALDDMAGTVEKLCA